jgi:hypothetical protein
MSKTLREVLGADFKPSPDESPSSLGARLRRELDENVARKLEHAGERTHFPHGDTVGGTKAHFLQPTIEETRTWGNNAPINFSTDTTDQQVSIATPQLIHVLRKHPTTFTVLVVLNLGNNWVDEPADNWVFQFNVYCGVGQAQVNVIQLLGPPSGNLNNNSQFFATLEVPAHALQVSFQLSGSAENEGPKDALVSALAAPRFA